jgi:hypothetical protein
MFNGHICILLVKTNSVIYICHKKHGRKGVKCVLAVRDNKLNVGGIKDMSSEVAEGQDMHRKALGSHMEQNRTCGEPASEFQRLGSAGNCWGLWAPGTPVDPQANIG